MPRYEIPQDEVEKSWDETELEELVPEGWYASRITDFTVRKSSAGNPNVSWEFTICDGDYDGYKVWGNTAITQNAIWKLTALGNAVGYPLQKGISLIGQLDEILGREVGIQVIHREWNGTQRANVDSFAATKENGEVMDATELVTEDANATVNEDSENKVPF